LHRHAKAGAPPPDLPQTGGERKRGAVRSGAEPLAPARTTGVEHLATARSSHPGSETMTALAHKLARLIGPLHGLPL
jgi:hypothetical protein